MKKGIDFGKYLTNMLNESEQVLSNNQKNKDRRGILYWSGVVSALKTIKETYEEE